MLKTAKNTQIGSIFPFSNRKVIIKDFKQTKKLFKN